jgi:hypothetical protein
MALSRECLFILLLDNLPCQSRSIGFQKASQSANTYHCLFLLLKFQSSERLNQDKPGVRYEVVVVSELSTAAPS